MQEEDWGKYSQAPWMTGGAWKDTDRSHHSKKDKKPKTSQAPLTNYPPSDRPSQDETNFRPEVNLADLQIKLQRWTFARNWKSAPSTPPTDEASLSPRCRPIDLDKSPNCPNKKPPLSRNQATTTNATTCNDLAAPPLHQTAKPTPPLDSYLMAQYLDQCIAAAESQLAGAGDKSRNAKREAVREIERLVERVVVQAGLTE